MPLPFYTNRIERKFDQFMTVFSISMISSNTSTSITEPHAKFQSNYLISNFNFWINPFPHIFSFFYTTHSKKPLLKLSETTINVSNFMETKFNILSPLKKKLYQIYPKKMKAWERKIKAFPICHSNQSKVMVSCIYG